MFETTSLVRSSGQAWKHLQFYAAPVVWREADTDGNSAFNVSMHPSIYFWRPNLESISHTVNGQSTILRISSVFIFNMRILTYFSPDIPHELKIFSALKSKSWFFFRDIVPFSRPFRSPFQENSFGMISGQRRALRVLSPRTSPLIPQELGTNLFGIKKLLILFEVRSVSFQCPVWIDLNPTKVSGHLREHSTSESLINVVRRQISKYFTLMLFNHLVSRTKIAIGAFRYQSSQNIITY